MPVIKKLPVKTSDFIMIALSMLSSTQQLKEMDNRQSGWYAEP